MNGNKYNVGSVVTLNSHPLIPITIIFVRGDGMYEAMYFDNGGYINIVQNLPEEALQAYPVLPAPVPTPKP